MNLGDIVSEIRTLSCMELTARLRTSILLHRHPTAEFFSALSERDHCRALKMCLLAWEVSVGITVKVEAR
jgi:hypothetical protein